MTGWLWVGAAFLWAALVGAVMLFLHGGTKGRDTAQRPTLGADVSESGPFSSEAGEPPSRSSADGDS